MLAELGMILALGGAELVGGVIDGGDALYGATSIGGPHCLSQSRTDFINVGCGVVYRVAYDGSHYSVLHAFAGPDGRKPVGSLVVGPGGDIYGATAAGGTNGAGVIYALARNGQAFRVIYQFPSPDPSIARDAPIVRTDSASIYTVATDSHGATQILRIVDGAARTLQTFQAGTHVRDLQVDEQAVYVLIGRDGQCGSAIQRLDPSGVATLLFSETVRENYPRCSSQANYGSIVVERNVVYALERRYMREVNPQQIDRINSGRVEPFFGLPSTDPLDYRAPFFRATAMIKGPSGQLLLTTSPYPGLNCGAVLAIDSTGRVASATVLPPGASVLDAACGAWSTPEMQPALTLAKSGDLYGTTPAGCVDIGETLADSCGSVFTLRRTGELYAIHTFASRLRDDPLVTPSPRNYYEILQTSSDARHLFLTRTSLGTTLVAQTPSPQPVRLTSLENGSVVTLPFERATTVRSILDQEGVTVPAFEYRLPRVPVGMYDLGFALNDIGGGPVYFPAVSADPLLRVGQRFVALPETMPHFAPMTDPDGNLLGTSVVSHRGDVYRFRVTATGAVLTAIGDYRAATDVPGLTPIIPDEVAQRVHERYAGKTVSALQLMGTCVSSSGDAMLMRVVGRLRVRAVYRLYGVATPMTINASGAGGPFGFDGFNPLVIIFDRPASARMTAGIGNFMTTSPGGCAEFYAFAADPWHVDHMLFLRPSVDLSWPSAMRASVARGDVLVGMTREMVVSAIGYPPVYASAEQLNELDDWKYEGPSQRSEVFFRNDRVIRYDPSGPRP